MNVLRNDGCLMSNILLVCQLSVLLGGSESPYWESVHCRKAIHTMYRVSYTELYIYLSL